MEQYKHQELHKERQKQQPATFSKYRPVTIPEKYGGRCTFCGAPLEPGVSFCTECGNAVKGIPCPRCGTLSFRSFCSNCNYPLNEQAKEALAEAEADPHFRKAVQLAHEMAELEKIIQAGGTSEEENERREALSAKNEDRSRERPDETVKLTEAHRSLLATYSELFDTPIGAPSKSHPAPAHERPGKHWSKEEAMAAYRAKAAELQTEMDAMMPPSASTPEEQRNFFSARKITTVELQLKPMGWICNYCGCTHRQPSECVEPELGGKWIIGEVETTVEKDLID